MGIRQLISPFDGKIDTARVERAWAEAVHHHDSTNCTYGGKPYAVHLYDALSFAVKYLHLMPQSKWEDLLVAVIYHDVTEDCRVSHNDVKKAQGEQVKEWVFAVHNENGRDRVERALLTYPKIRRFPETVFIKLCDRFANMSNSLEPGTTMGRVYVKEHHVFCYALKRTEPEFRCLMPMWTDLDILFGEVEEHIKSS